MMPLAFLHHGLAASTPRLSCVLQYSEGWQHEREELLAKLSGLESWKDWANTRITQLIQRVKAAERPPNKDDSLRLKDEVRRCRRVAICGAQSAWDITHMMSDIGARTGVKPLIW